MKIFFTIACLLFLCSCQQSLQEAILEKIEIFERNEQQHFKEILLYALRNSRRQDPLEFVIQKKDVLGKAIIQIHPEQIIHQNFPRISDSIQLDIVRVIDSLEIRELYNMEAGTHLKFWYNDQYVVLYRGILHDRIEAYEPATPVQEVIRDWSYFTFKLKSG